NLAVNYRRASGISFERVGAGYAEVLHPFLAQLWPSGDGQSARDCAEAVPPAREDVQFSRDSGLLQRGVEIGAALRAEAVVIDVDHKRRRRFGSDLRISRDGAVADDEKIRSISHVELGSGERGERSAGRESHQTDSIRIDMPILRMAAHQRKGALRI